MRNKDEQITMEPGHEPGQVPQRILQTSLWQSSLKIYVE